MSLIEVDNLAKTFKTRERAAGLASSLRSFLLRKKGIHQGGVMTWNKQIKLEYGEQALQVARSLNMFDASLT